MWGIIFLVTMSLFFVTLVFYLIFKRVNKKKLAQIREQKKQQKIEKKEV